uniref:Uncharacterized protein n=1 Tax=Ditylenchus dipsaci TaxID=166011 RepID=A0A915E459_9BILA
MFSWKPKIIREKTTIKEQYTINFGQTATSRKKRRWNPHICVAHHLAEKFNRDKDLSQLVQYLISTSESLESIYNFNAAVPVELQSNLTMLNDTTLRLTYGGTHLEFLLLSDNQVAIRDCSRPTYSSNTSFEAFWRKQMEDTHPVLPSTSSAQDNDKPNSPKPRGPSSPTTP